MSNQTKKPAPFLDIIYLAYGSNMNKAQMAVRCPSAKPMGLMLLPDYKLVFKNVADIVHSPGDNAVVVAWRITKGNENTLDAYEGCNEKSPEDGLYKKIYWKAKTGQGYMAYVMNDRYGISPPGQSYYDGIQNGYQDFGADVSYLETALSHSIANQSGRGYVRKKKINPASSKPKWFRQPKFWQLSKDDPSVPF